MSTHLSIDLPNDQTLTVGDLAAFVDHARIGGATDQTTITPLHADMDDSILTGWQIELQPPTAGADRPVVVAGSLLRDLVDLLSAIDAHNGDAESLIVTVLDLRADLLNLLLPPPGPCEDPEP